MIFPKRVNRIAIVLQNASTGGWRYTCRLIEGMRAARPSSQITVYLGRSVNKVCEGESAAEILRSLSAEVKPAPWLKPRFRNRSKLANFAHSARRALTARSYRQWVAELNGFDCVLFAWPYGIDCPECSVPVVFVPHDFNYTHFMGTFIESDAACRSLRSQHLRWLELATPIVSTHFIAHELKRNFQQYTKPPKVVYLSHFGSQESLQPGESRKLLQKLGVEGDFILCLNNISAHKNLGQVLGAFHYVLQQYPQMRLIVAGFGTEGIRGDANCPLYIDNVDQGGHVVSLGLRRDCEVAALITHAKLVINASLYEAGNGSGLDAWSMGTPVAMSAIPAFLEQMHALKVRAETFNPRCVYEIRDAMLRILDEPELATANATYSKLALQRYGWVDVAHQYLEYFDCLAATATARDPLMLRTAG